MFILDKMKAEEIQVADLSRHVALVSVVCVYFGFILYFVLIFQFLLETQIT